MPNSCQKGKVTVRLNEGDFPFISKSPSLMEASYAFSMPSMRGTVTVGTRNIADNRITSGS